MFKRRVERKQPSENTAAFIELCEAVAAADF